MTESNYLAEVPATFNDLACQFCEQVPRVDGLLESHAGKLAADVMAHLALLVDNDELTPGQLWSALAAERGNAGACNAIANMARAAHGQLIENKTTISPGPGVPMERDTPKPTEPTV